MERDEALSALREVAVEVLSVEPDAVVEDGEVQGRPRRRQPRPRRARDGARRALRHPGARRKTSRTLLTVGNAVDLVMAKVDAKT